jgi:hypothetical protein
LRILFVGQLYPPDGGAASARTWEFATRLAAKGHEVTVIAGRPSYPTGVVAAKYRRRLFVREREDGVDAIRCWCLPGRRSNTLATILSLLSFPLTAWLAAGRAGSHDVVVATSPSPLVIYPALRAARRSRCPLLFDVRDIWPGVLAQAEMLEAGSLPYRILQRLERKCYRAADKIAVVTAGKLEVLLAAGVPREKLVLLLNGANTDLCRPEGPPPPDWGSAVPEGTFVVTYAGYYAGAQGLTYITEAARLLQDDLSVLFLMVGEGRVRSRIEQLSAALSLRNMRFLGERLRQEVPAILRVSHAALVPLRNSALTDMVPLKLFEAMACGVPVILCAAGEAAQIVRESGAGVVVAPADAEGLAQAIRDLAANPQLRAQMGRAGREYVLKHHDRAAVADELERVLLEMTSRPGPASG